MPKVVVAGAGQRGMLCAAELARAGAEVTVVEWLPAPGGQQPERWAGTLATSATQAGARFLLETLAVQFSGTFVEVLGAGGTSHLACDALVVATGSRPATRAELGITGDRCAGVVPGSAALHLTRAGVLLGHRPLIAGSGQFALRCARAQLAAGASEVSLTMPDGSSPAVGAAIRMFPGYRVISVHGASRVEVAVVRNHQESLRVRADALILAAGMRPTRNIEGAIERRDGVFFCQPQDEAAAMPDVRAAASQTASLVRATFGSGQFVPVQTDPPLFRADGGEGDLDLKISARPAPQITTSRRQRLRLVAVRCED
jgi:NADPH-dependent 2,4-dienoyl-CoA reductase/sulfur reductase-like enzyme